MNGRYEAVFGFNSKQWWAYDNKTEEYCDPPASVLFDIANHSDDIDEQQRFFEAILEKEPEWLNDKEHRYGDITDV